MPKSPEVRLSAAQISHDGATPQAWSPSNLNLTSATEQGAKLYSHRAEVKSVRARVRTAVGTGTATIGVGKQGSNAFFGSITFTTTDAAATIKQMALAQTVLAPDDVLTVTVTGAGTGAGAADLEVVTQPLPA